ncbi:MAG: glycosyltransferase family 4 protein [Candidatus Methylomirabilales bacterium]
MIRIARVITRLNIGGPAWHAILLAAGLDPGRFSTTLIAGSVGPAEGDFGEVARARGVEPVIIPELARPIRPQRDLIALWKLVRCFRRLRPDIVHTHTAKAGTLGRLAGRMARVPRLVHTFHGHVLDGYFSPLAARTFLAVERGLARRTDRLVAVSPRLREALLRMGIGRPEQVEAIPLGLDLDRFAAVRRNSLPVRRDLRLPPDARLLAIVGRLVPIKDHPTLFAALGRLDPGVHLLVVGDGGSRGALEALVRGLGLSDRVHFLGWRQDLDVILSGTDVVVSCSINEGTPVALIEAMAAGVPVVSTDVGGVGDLVVPERTGWLVPPGDPAALASALREVLAAPALAAARAEAARRFVLERHTAERLIRHMTAFYERLTEESRCVSW